MSFVVSPLFDDLYTAVRAFLVAALPVSADNVIKWQQNRTAPPPGGTALSASGYATMQIINARRLRTNVDTWDYTDPNPDSIVREQGVRVEMQLDLYGPVSGDWAAIVSTLWRDDYACLALAPTCQPLHADEPIFADFTDSEQQYEQRWIVRAVLQYNPTVSTPSQFADIVEVSPIINVDVEYPVD
jgi:hypothetical protein